MTTYKNGIYFGLPMDDYLSIQRCSKSAIKQLMISPADWWRGSWLDPNPPKLTADQKRRNEIAKLLGSAYHCARLEPHLFDDQFAREPAETDFAKILTNGTQVGNELAELGEAKKKAGESVEEQAQRYVDAGGKIPVMCLVQKQFREELGDRLAVPAADFDQIKVDQERLRSVPSVDSALSDGAAEVTILYDCPETGLPMKARIDWLADERFVELKTFANPSGKELMRCLNDAIKFNRYYIDGAAYSEATEAIRTGDLPVHNMNNTDGALDLIGRIQAHPRPLEFKIAWQQKGGIPNILVTPLDLHLVPLTNQIAEPLARSDEQARQLANAAIQPSLLLRKGQGQIKRAKRTFMQYCEIYNDGEPWLPIEGERRFSDLDFSPYWMEDD